MFCKKCGKEMKDGWKICPGCGSSIEGAEITDVLESKNMEKQKKTKKPILKKWWFWILLIVGVFLAFAFMNGNEDDDSKADVASKTEIVDAAEKMEVKTLEEVGGIEGWEENDYKGRVRAYIVVSLPITPRDDDNYAVQLQTSFGTTVMVTQEDDTPAKEWTWLMNAEPFDEDYDTSYFEATLIHCGGTVIDDKVIPRFIVTDIKSDSELTEPVMSTDMENSFGQVEEPITDDEVSTVPITVINNTGIDIYGLYASTIDTDDWEEDILGFEVLEAGESVDINFSFASTETRWDFAMTDIYDNVIEFYDMDLSEYSSNGAILTLTYDGENGHANLEER